MASPTATSEPLGEKLKRFLQSDISLSRKPKEQPATDAASPKRRRKAAKEPTRRVGALLDLGETSVVEIDQGRVVSVRTVPGPPGEILADVLDQAETDGATVTLAWAGSDTHLRRVERPKVPDAVLPGVLESIAFDAMSVGAGEFLLGSLPYDVVDDSVDPPQTNAYVTLVGVETARLGDTLAAAAGNDAAVVPLELIFATDGLYLAILQGTTELILVEGGAATAARHLQCGGVADLVAQLGTGGRDGEVRLANVMRGLASQDPEAAELVDDYVNTLAEDIQSTTVHWQRYGSAVPSTLFVFGRGATLPNLTARLHNIAFQVAPPPLPAAVDDSVVPRGERFAAYPAVAAAMAGVAERPSVELPNAVRDEARRRKVSSARRQRIITATGLVAATIGLLLLVPLLQSHSELRQARSELETDQQTLTAVADAEALGDAVRSGQATYTSSANGEVEWERYFTDALRLVPPGTRVTNLTFAPVICPQPGEIAANDAVAASGAAPAGDGEQMLAPVTAGGCLLVTVSGQVPGASFAPVAQWIRTVEAEGGQGAWVSSLQPSEGDAGQSVTLTYAVAVSEDSFTERRAPGINTDPGSDDGQG